MTDLVTALSQRVLICDGAMGTILHAAGNSLDRALPEGGVDALVLETFSHPEVRKAFARSSRPAVTTASGPPAGDGRWRDSADRRLPLSRSPADRQQLIHTAQLQVRPSRPRQVVERVGSAEARGHRHSERVPPVGHRHFEFWVVADHGQVGGAHADAVAGGAQGIK
jgi:hypothetical protein